jgi:hypothetical protein
MDALADPVERVAADTGFSSVVPVDRDDEVRLAKAYGLAHRGWALANTIATRLAIAGGTKGLTALTQLGCGHGVRSAARACGRLREAAPVRRPGHALQEPRAQRVDPLHGTEVRERHALRLARAQHERRVPLGQPVRLAPARHGPERARAEADILDQHAAGRKRRREHAPPQLGLERIAPALQFTRALRRAAQRSLCVLPSYSGQLVQPRAQLRKPAGAQCVALRRARLERDRLAPQHGVEDRARDGGVAGEALQRQR